MGEMKNTEGDKSNTTGTIRLLVSGAHEFDLVDDGDCLIEFEIIEQQLEAGCIAPVDCPRGCAITVSELDQGDPAIYIKQWEVKCQCLEVITPLDAVWTNATIVQIENTWNPNSQKHDTFRVKVLGRGMHSASKLTFVRHSSGMWSALVDGTANVNTTVYRQKQARRNPGVGIPTVPSRTPKDAVHLVTFEIT